MLSKFLFLLVSVLTFSSVKSQGFTCKSTRISKCKSLAGYVSPKANTLSSIANLFGLTDFNSFLGANSLSIEETSPNKSVASNETIKIPFTCSCNNGTGISDNTPVYKVKAGEGLDHIARDIYSSLITFQEIADANNISDPNKIEIGQSLMIPLPCSCDAVDDNQVVHYAHKVSPKETLEMIGKEFGVTEKTLLSLNHLHDAKDLKAESVLDVPLKVCTSMVSNTSPDYPLLVPDGTYTFTANNCVRCECNTKTDKKWTLGCSSSPPDIIKVENWPECPSDRCVGNDFNYGLGMDDYYLNSHCITKTCAYTGYNNQSQTISSSMVNLTKCGPELPPGWPLFDSPSMNLQGWNILSLGLLLCSFLLILE
ncbi:hypothetical protein MKX01_005027 [Papaver californicum]|nr:hypothetical protein MKX01_005027 [Papaver californicum]